MGFGLGSLGNLNMIGLSSNLASGGFGGDKQKTQTTTNAPWGGVQPYLTDAYSNLGQYATQPVSYFPGQTYANFDPAQMQSQQMALNYAGGLQPAINNTMNAYNYGMNSVYDPQSNPVIQQYVQSATRPIEEARQQMNGVQNTNDAVASGGLGGSRQGVAEGITNRAALNAMGDVTSGIYNNAYNNGLMQQARMAALAPQTMSLGLMPSQITGQVGDIRQQQAQNAINEQMNRYNFNQMGNFDRANQYVSTLQGNPWSTSTVPNPNQANPIAGALGGAMSGAQIGSAVPGLGTGYGALIGAGLGLFGSQY